MSFNTWRNEFYPTSAAMSEKGNAIQHSLTKWLGLRKASLEKHNVRLVKSMSTPCVKGRGRDSILHISEGSCSLCNIYLFPDKGSCSKCPLYKVLGNKACAAPGGGESSLPYDIFYNELNPGPMIKALREALRAEKKKTKR